MAREGLLEGKVAVITAAGSGMGRAAALRFSAEGATVVAADIDEGKANAVAAEADGAIEPYVVDVADLAALSGLYDHIRGKHGRLEVLYHHAGIPGPAGLDVEEADWQRAIDINMRAVFYSATYGHRLLADSGGGSMIFTSSISGIVGSPLSPMYSMTKGGVVLLAKALALSLAPSGIRVNAICPGSVDTPMFPTFFERFSEEEAEKVKQAYISSIPLARIAQPEEIASAALFLASDLSSYVTGHALPVDGGISAK
jgi:NAD(P)-dependent dehydrogenase (short-subunit alcohol dehydrogenase family)